MSIPGLPDVLGDLTSGLGATRVSARRSGAMSVARQVRDRREANIDRAEDAIVDPVPGVSHITPKLLPLGSTPIQFTDASALILRSTAEVFKPFQAYVLRITIVRSVAGSGGAINISQLLVGAVNQRPNGTVLSAEIFGPDSVNVSMKLSPASPGVPIFIDFQATTQPGTGETVDVVPTWFGLTLAQ